MENDVNCIQLSYCSFQYYTALNEPTKFKANVLLVHFRPHTFSISSVLIQAKFVLRIG